MKKFSQTRVAVLLVLAFLSVGFLSGCGGGNQVQPPAGNNNVTPDPAGEMPSGSYQIKGSDSEVNVVQSLVEAFYEINPNVEFSVTGGGSGVGISALTAGEIDVANSSRPMSDSEIESARANGVEPIPIVFAMDGLAVIIHADNQVENLTVEQVGKIFAGEITNWSEVGGADSPISLYGRQSNSGTYVFFRERVVKGDYSPAKKNMNGNSQIVEGVRADVSGIGYVAMGFIQGTTGIKAVGLAETAAGPFVTPTELDRVKAGEYVLTRPLYQYYGGQPTGALLQFLEFVLSAEGQLIIEEAGFLPATAEFMQENRAYLN
ncbi:MAG: PstS family phosphate ABC transporter substrate-binding protein [Dethiobacter sp.]|jgi:phosphate transport system substrate-binding protein|nr:PstS family phosphate ABC transporter substrate-binding protein [Dethiobacter sp.]MBS3988592.1 PstS family phosphate ABC transporter substrate-binding protein [Dethiobacter sp.]